MVLLGSPLFSLQSPVESVLSSLSPQLALQFIWVPHMQFTLFIWKDLIASIFSELVPLPSYSDLYYQSLSLYQNLIVILNSFPLPWFLYPVSDQDLCSSPPLHSQYYSQRWTHFGKRTRNILSWTYLQGYRMGRGTAVKLESSSCTEERFQKEAERK